MQQQPPYQQIPPQQTPPAKPVGIAANPWTLPFYILYLGNIWLVAYVALLGVVTYQALTIADGYLQSALTSPMIQFGVSREAAFRFSVAAHIIVWIFSAPVMITAVALPARILWLHKTLVLEQLAEETFTSLRFSVSGLYLAIRQSIYYLAPALALIVVYFTYVQSHPLASTQQFYLLAAALFGVALLFKLVPVFGSVIVSVCGQDHPVNTIFSAVEVYRGHTIKLFLIVFVAIAACLGIHYLWHQGRWMPFKIGWPETAIYLAIAWYSLARISVLTLRRLTELAMSKR